jgi:hypothetical protein
LLVCLFVFSAQNTILHPFLVFKVSIEESVVILIGLLLHVFFFFSSRLQYSFLVLCATCFKYNLLWRGLFRSCLFGVLEASCTWVDIFCLKFENFSATILFNIIGRVLLAHLLFLQCLWFADLFFWYNCRVLIYSFHSSWLFCLRILFFFSLICIFVFKPWNFVFHLF